MPRSIDQESSRDGIGNGAQRSAHVLLIPHAALPHITPMVHLAQQLASLGGVTCTILGFDHLIDKVVKDGVHPAVHLLGLPKNLTGYSPQPEWLPPDVHSEELRCTTEPYLQDLLRKKAAGEDGPNYTFLISDFLLHWTIRAVSIATAHHKSLMGAKRVLLNTLYELESRPIDYLRKMGHDVTTVGPLQSSFQVSKVSFEDCNYVDDECLQWLDKQPAKSVVYVNFGTTGFNFFTLQMVHELALGLEASEASFLWVLRPPPLLKADELDQLLPSGFEERVKDRALISRGWAPQLKILEHPSTAAFFMQCGWNSITETVTRGIPFIGWATFADQPYNARYAAEGANVGLLLPHGEKKIDRHDIETAVKTMMFSDTGLLKKKTAEEMKIAASNAVKP